MNDNCNHYNPTSGVVNHFSALLFESYISLISPLIHCFKLLKTFICNKIYDETQIAYTVKLVSFFYNKRKLVLFTTNCTVNFVCTLRLFWGKPDLTIHPELSQATVSSVSVQTQTPAISPVVETQNKLFYSLAPTVRMATYGLLGGSAQREQLLRPCLMSSTGYDSALLGY
jgi:hypothetical protein